jgi:PKD repeat protein
MKHLSHLLLIGILLCAVMVVPVSATVYNNFTPIFIDSNTNSNNPGSIANSSSVYDASYLAYKAFDNRLSTLFNSATGDEPAWLWVYTPTGHVLTKYTITAPNSYAESPWRFNISGSNDKTTWDVLDTQSVTWTTPFEVKTFTISNTVSYKYHRIFGYCDNPGTTFYAVSEFTLYETVDIPVASFTVNTTSGIAPQAVQFNDTSSNTPTSWQWGRKNLTVTTWEQFSTVQNATQTFVQGNWSVNLTATNAAGSNISASQWVNVSAGIPTAIFSTNVTSGVNPLALYLNDTSTGSPTMWNTSWGNDRWTNETSFPATNITHTYSTAGSYYINQYATNAYGTANGTPILITVYGYANSQFSSFNTAGTAPFTTYLYDTSTNTTGGTNSWYWVFGDGNVSTAQNLFYTWNMTGTFSVNHSFSNGLSTSWKNQSAYITVGTPTPPVVAPVASFYGGPEIGDPPLRVYLTDVSTNTPTSWDWDFGDGGAHGTTQNPEHWYNLSGFYTVGLTATNSAGSNTTSKTNFIMVY